MGSYACRLVMNGIPGKAPSSTIFVLFSAAQHKHNVALGDSFGARFAAFGGIHAPLTARFAIALVDWRCTSTFGDCIKAISGWMPPSSTMFWRLSAATVFVSITHGQRAADMEGHNPKLASASVEGKAYHSRPGLPRRGQPDVAPPRRPWS